MRFLEIDLKTKILHIIECGGPLLFLQSIYKSGVLGDIHYTDFVFMKQNELFKL